jgi:hypothetical protein
MRHRDGTVGDNEDFEGGVLERVALGDAVNLLLHRAGVGVDVDGAGFRGRPQKNSSLPTNYSPRLSVFKLNGQHAGA